VKRHALILICCSLFDGAATAAEIQWGVAEEVNALLVPIIVHYGLGTFLGLKVFVTGLSGAMIFHCLDRAATLPLCVTALRVVTSIFVLLTALHFYVIARACGLA
jgi:hypothetical protein